MILKPFLMISLWSIILAVAIYPLFRWLKTGLGNKRILASVLVTVFLLMLILLPVILLGGSLGNLSDRMFRAPGPGRGEVVDFLQLPHYPIFNIADSAIVSAAVLIAVMAFRGVSIDGTRSVKDSPKSDHSLSQTSTAQPPEHSAGLDHDV